MRELIRVLKRILIKEMMLELLTYEPFGKFLPAEETYICKILSGNDNPPPSLAKFHELFLYFYNYYIQNRQNRNSKNISWLRRWKNKYIQNKNYTHSTKIGRVYYPLLFKKICFYVMIRREFADKEFMGILGLPVNRIRKWGISTRFRRYAGTDTYSVISSFRNGVKKPYIVSFVKKLYYEAGRQVSHSILLTDLPTFVDVFAGTASVAASVVSDGCPPPIVNDFDPLMICFDWAFTFHQKELRNKIADLYNWLMKLDFNSINWRYGETAYEDHYGFLNSIMRLKPEEYWVDKVKKYWEKEMRTNPKFWESFAFPIVMHSLDIKYSYSEIAENKQKAQRYKESIIRIRSLYLAAKAEMDSCDRNTLRASTDFNVLSKNTVAVFQFYSFKPGGKNIFHVSSVDEHNYSAYLDRLKDVGFFDDDHKDMLDLLRTAKFKWIFSMQYKPSETCDCTIASDKAKRKKQPHIIRDYGAYYRGFYTPFQLDTDQRSYVATDTPMEDAKNLYAILFDVKTAKAKRQEIYRNTNEMLVVNFNCLPTIPLHDSAVVLPFALFLQCADS